ncbi:VOC family protein [candidate division GN15 bacterium]|nr:VOC family protein [candidate division GN15 bacterium]
MANDRPAHGTFCWNELVTHDVEKAEKFYGDLIGWKITDSGMPGMVYKMLNAGEIQAGGLMAMPPEVPKDVPSHWMSYITVEDVDASAKKARELGAELIHGPQDIPTVGRFCIIKDPVGAVVSLITLKMK